MRVLDTILSLSVTCDRMLVSSINKTDNHDITEILLKVALNTITLRHRFLMGFNCVAQSLVFCIIFCQPLLVVWPLPLAILNFVLNIYSPFLLLSYVQTFHIRFWLSCLRPLMYTLIITFHFFFYFPSCWLYMIHNCYME